VDDFFGSIETLPEERKTRKWIDVLKNAISLLIASFAIPEMEEIQNALLDVIETGIPALAVPDGARFDELDEISRIERSELYESNRLFDAIAASIKEFGIHQTTMETIAAKMGTAKSSLYFYSKNKTTMLRDLIKSETGTIMKLCTARASSGKTLAEQLYITMSVQTNYLLLKPDINPVFNWIRYETIGANPESKDHFGAMEKTLEPYRFGELFTGGPINLAYASMTIRWASILAVSFVIHAIELKLPDADIKFGLRSMLESMLRGDAK
jgi:AcrR family transcriptional regulator